TLDEVEVPDAPVVRLAIGRKVPWNKVQELMAAVEARGGRPVLLVGDFHKVKVFRLEDTWTGDEPAIRVIAYVDGKACVQPPGAIEAKCVQSGDRSYIDRAFLRELVREQVKLYHPRVEVELASTLNWADVVRTIDGSRTCCYETRVIVRLAPPSHGAADPTPAPAGVLVHGTACGSRGGAGGGERGGRAPRSSRPLARAR